MLFEASGHVHLTEQMVLRSGSVVRTEYTGVSVHLTGSRTEKIIAALYGAAPASGWQPDRPVLLCVVQAICSSIETYRRKVLMAWGGIGLYLKIATPEIPKRKLLISPGAKWTAAFPHYSCSTLDTASPATCD